MATPRLHTSVSIDATAESYLGENHSKETRSGPGVQSSIEDGKGNGDNEEPVAKQTADSSASGFYDACILYAKEDTEKAMDVQEYQNNLELNNNEHPKVCLYDVEEFSGSFVSLPGAIILRCTLVFILMTENFEKYGRKVEFLREELLGLTRIQSNNEDQRYSVRLLHTTKPDKHGKRNYRIPDGMASIVTYDVYDIDNRIIRDKFVKLFELKLSYRKNREKIAYKKQEDKNEERSACDNINETSEDVNQETSGSLDEELKPHEGNDLQQPPQEIFADMATLASLPGSKLSNDHVSRVSSLVSMAADHEHKPVGSTQDETGAVLEEENTPSNIRSIRLHQTRPKILDSKILDSEQTESFESTDTESLESIDKEKLTGDGDDKEDLGEPLLSKDLSIDAQGHKHITEQTGKVVWQFGIDDEKSSRSNEESRSALCRDYTETESSDYQKQLKEKANTTCKKEPKDQEDSPATPSQQDSKPPEADPTETPSLEDNGHDIENDRNDLKTHGDCWKLQSTSSTMTYGTSENTIVTSSKREVNGSGVGIPIEQEEFSEGPTRCDSFDDNALRSGGDLIEFANSVENNNNEKLIEERKLATGSKSFIPADRLPESEGLKPQEGNDFQESPQEILAACALSSLPGSNLSNDHVSGVNSMAAEHKPGGSTQDKTGAVLEEENTPSNIRSIRLHQTRPKILDSEQTESFESIQQLQQKGTGHGDDKDDPGEPSLSKDLSIDVEGIQGHTEPLSGKVARHFDNAEKQRCSQTLTSIEDANSSRTCEESHAELYQEPETSDYENEVRENDNTHFRNEQRGQVNTAAIPSFEPPATASKNQSSDVNLTEDARNYLKSPNNQLDLHSTHGTSEKVTLTTGTRESNDSGMGEEFGEGPPTCDSFDENALRSLRSGDDLIELANSIQNSNNEKLDEEGKLANGSKYFIPVDQLPESEGFIESIEDDIDSQKKTLTASGAAHEGNNLYSSPASEPYSIQETLQYDKEFSSPTKENFVAAIGPAHKEHVCLLASPNVKPEKELGDSYASETKGNLDQGKKPEKTDKTEAESRTDEHNEDADDVPPPKKSVSDTGYATTIVNIYSSSHIQFDNNVSVRQVPDTSSQTGRRQDTGNGGGSREDYKDDPGKNEETGDGWLPRHRMKAQMADVSDDSSSPLMSSAESSNSKMSSDEGPPAYDPNFDRNISSCPTARVYPLETDPGGEKNSNCMNDESVENTLEGSRKSKKKTRGCFPFCFCVGKSRKRQK